MGLHDADVLRLSHDNYLGLLHPAVQHVLDATFRVQAEEERGVLARIRSGDLKVETTIGEDRLSREVRTQVQLTGGEAEEQAFVAQRRSDPTFYFRCREAAAGIADDPPTLRAAHAAVRAWLAARDEDAAPPVLERLGQAVRRIGSDALTAGMADADARALTRLLAPTPPAGPTTRRKGRARSHLPLHPGRSGLSR